MKNDRGFTLIEMMVVLLIISVLLLITIPNVAKSNEVVDSKGCDAFIELVEAQIQLYKVDNSTYPDSINTLESAGYLDRTTCPDGTAITIGGDGSVLKNEPTLEG